MIDPLRTSNGRPPAPPGGGQPPPPEPRTAAGRDQPVLVVDDDEGIVAMLREFLEGEGFSVRTAANGAEALDALQDVSPSVILLDMRMPVLDGWGFASALRRRGGGFPIVVMTAAESAQRWAEEIGADGYIAKPFDVNELLQAIERFKRRPRPN